jgi:hypothetical protein
VSCPVRPPVDTGQTRTFVPSVQCPPIQLKPMGPWGLRRLWMEAGLRLPLAIEFYFTFRFVKMQLAPLEGEWMPRSEPGMANSARGSCAK